MTSKLLRQWIYRNNLTISAFAEKIGISRSAMNIVLQAGAASKEVADKIYDVTNKEVSMPIFVYRSIRCPTCGKGSLKKINEDVS